MSRGPVAKFRSEGAIGVQVAVWANEGKFGKFYTTTLSYSKKDKESGEYKEFTSIPASMGHAVAALYQRAASYVDSLEREKNPVTDTKGAIAPSNGTTPIEQDDIPF